MFNSAALQSHFEDSQTVKGDSLIIAEWNLNDPENIEKIGNYFHPVTDISPPNPNVIYDPDDTAGAYTGGTDADVEIYGPYDESEEPTIFIEEKLKTKLLYSLDDCFRPHRPRSGINYARYLPGSYLTGNSYNSSRPRYYMGHYNNTFKYWSSFRENGGTVKGLSWPEDSGRHMIEDVAPFVVYNNDVPTNKIVVKVQTNVGTYDAGFIRTQDYNSIADPLYGDANATVPNVWRVQVLKNNTWNTVKEFNENDVRSDDSAIFGADGYVELAYGIQFPSEYATMQKRYKGMLVSSSNLPAAADQGDYYLVVPSDGDLGSVHIFTTEWEVFFPEYGWSLREDYDVPDNTVSSLTAPPTYDVAGDTYYREFDYIGGIRLVVDSMNKEDCTFDLIELSPRLVVDISDYVVKYRLTKSIGNIDATKVPVGQLQAGICTLELFDHDEAFREGNPNSIIADHLASNLSFYFWEAVRDVPSGDTYYDYFVPIKKLYSENKRPKYSKDAHVTYELRDLYYLFERTDAPSLLMTNVSLSVAVATLLDNIGFSNYTFKRITTYPEPVIPFFYVAPDQNVAEVLQKLSVATQAAMFFDEYNNFTVMYREYMMPLDDERDADMVLDGDSDTPNIVEIASDEKYAMNKGTITYTERYIQRSTGSLAQQNFVNEDQTWIYTPALLWEVTGSEAVRTINESKKEQSSYALGAMPLASDLSATVPTVKNHQIINNTINVGDGVYWLPRFEGYLYAAGEIIKFDAVQYSVQGQGTVWIRSNAEYQKYMAELPFNGKMYPTGIIRIFAEPDIQQDDTGTLYVNGAVRKHGRGQFGTQIVSHSAGLDSYWSGTSYLRSVQQQSQYLFDGVETPAVVNGGAISSSAEDAARSLRTGVIKNFLRDVQYAEYQNGPTLTINRPTIQSSAFVFQGQPREVAGSRTRDFITYSYKTLSGPFKHAGTRMRIVGQLSALADEEQEAAGSFQTYASVLNGEMKVLTGGSGGIAVGVNPTNNNGYFFEVMALSNANLDSIASESAAHPPHNLVFYKMAPDDSGNAVPVKLWGKLADVVVDSGEFVGESRDPGNEVDSVYDLNVEYKKIGSATRFYLYVNNTQVAVVDDTDPLDEYDSIALFVRGTSKCMFENFYAIGSNIAFDKSIEIVSAGSLSEAFGADALDSTALRKYSLSGILRASYLSGISPTGDDRYKIWYEEFGTIMRECAYFDVKYDRAFPALAAQISPTYNGIPGYTVSGFTAGSYGAKFLVFNATDKALDMGGDSANFLRIQGIAFTQNTSREYTMDDYYEEFGSLTAPALETVNNSLRTSEVIEKYRDIKIKRMKYGVSEFSLQSDYIQTQGEAMNLMAWLADKSTRTRQQIGVNIFFNPILQLGDIVTVDYTGDSAELVASGDTKFVVYNIELEKSSEGPATTIYLSEV